MTEAEWLACIDPIPMLDFLKDKADKRRCLLFACACERRLWGHPDCEREKVEVTELFADGQATALEVFAALEHIGYEEVTLGEVTDMDPAEWANGANPRELPSMSPISSSVDQEIPLFRQHTKHGMIPTLPKETPMPLCFEKSLATRSGQQQ